MKKCKVDQQGQSLIEMIVIVGMVVLLVTGIVAGTTASLSRSETSQTRSSALSFAQAGIELARGIRDNGWNTFVTMGSSGGAKYCVNSNSPPEWTESETCTPNIDSKFTRSVTLELTPASGMKVTSKVAWGDTTDPLNKNKVELTTYLTQWK
ncbi:MAG: hypothetical protein NT149_05145 [Candidatus Gottesmanbacteria bacterium]|nr:hypothetical protein [Candidatus Gottesmanbacteria bacterium]